MSETVPYRSLPEGVSYQEVSEKIGLSIDHVIDSSRDRVKVPFDIDEGTNEDVKRSIKNLRQRAELLAASIKPGADPEKLAFLDNYLTTYTDGIEAALPRVATSRLLLSKMIYRYGLGIQIQVDRLSPLDEETKSKLKEIDNEILYISEQ